MATYAGLPEQTQKDLLLDIKANGGLTAVVSEGKLEDICNAKAETYGEPGTSLRKKVQNKIDYI